MGLLIDVAVAKTNKDASRDSGDTVEIVERPAGGIAIVLADGQGSGRSAKSLSQMATARAVAMLKDGVRERAVAEGVNDHLFAYRHGQVSSTIDVIGVDVASGSLVVARAGDTTLAVRTDAGTEVARATDPAGRYRALDPVTAAWPLAPGTLVALCSDGIRGSGARLGRPALDLAGWLGDRDLSRPACEHADALLALALERDAMRPADDMTVAVLRIADHAEERLVRRVEGEVPLP